MLSQLEVMLTSYVINLRKKTFGMLDDYNF